MAHILIDVLFEKVKKSTLKFFWNFNFLRLTFFDFSFFQLLDYFYNFFQLSKFFDFQKKTIIDFALRMKSRNVINQLFDKTKKSKIRLYFFENLLWFIGFNYILVKEMAHILIDFLLEKSRSRKRFYASQWRFYISTFRTFNFLGLTFFVFSICNILIFYFRFFWLLKIVF